MILIKQIYNPKKYFTFFVYTQLLWTVSLAVWFNSGYILKLFKLEKSTKLIHEYFEV